MSPFEEIYIDEQICLIKIENLSDNKMDYQKRVNKDIIHFYFNQTGFGKLKFNNGNYSMPIQEDKFIVLYNPEKNLNLDIELDPESRILSILVPIKIFHSFFSTEANLIGFLNKENEDQKHYEESEIPPTISIVINQILNCYMSNYFKNLYLKGKLYELFSLLFNHSESNSEEHCPYLSDKDSIMKIKKAKDILLSQMSEPPSLQKLADSVGINIKKLKLGFKELYGDTVYSFLFDYKMEYARKLLENKTHNVNEVGSKIGYSSSSHFISAFKKKFGTTPKKYTTSIKTNTK